MVNRYQCMSVGLYVALLAGLSACTYLIPDDPSQPRYNIVLGEKHRPLNNHTDAPPPGQVSMTPFSQSVEVPQPVQMAQNTANPSLPPLPPVDDATRARADQILGAAPPPAQSTMNERRRPVENPPLESEAPSISSVPPRPVYSASENLQSRMDDTRRDLEQDRARAQVEKSRLASEAAAEPSMLTGRPGSVTIPENIRGSSAAPAYAPPPSYSPAPAYTPPPGVSQASTQPITGLAPMPTPVASAPVPPPAPAQPAYIALPPPLPPMNSAKAPGVDIVPPPAPVAVSEAPPPRALAPIRLTPPDVAYSPPPAPVRAFTPVPDVAPRLQPATSSGFDPFAHAPAPARAGSGDAAAGYLPPSRYANKR